MAYRYETEQNGRKALVFSGWERGVADSPYSGVANIRNLGASYYPGVAYVNYKRLAATLSGGSMTKPMFSTKSGAGLIYILDDSQQIWKQNSVGSSTFTKVTGNPTSTGTGNGLAWWQNYLVVFRGTSIDICGDGTGDGGVTSSNWNTAAGTTGVWPITSTTLTLTGTPTAGAGGGTTGTALLTANPAAAATSATLNSSWALPTGSYLVTFSDAETKSVTFTNGSTAISWSGGLSNAVDATITYAGTVAATISTYTDAQGNGRAFWNGPTGIYQLTFGNGQITAGVLTQGSATITWTPSLYSSAASSSVTVTPVFSGTHQAFVSPSDGNLYFCNGQYIGTLSLNSADGYTTVVKGTMATFRFDYGTVRIQNETIGWLDQLASNLIIAGVSNIYTWDRISAQVSAPSYVPENIIKIKQVQNIVYIFAGYKGNIYQTNGAFVSLFKKVPDSFFNLIDPYLQWGGVMAHRNKMFLQVYASTASGTGQYESIFSISLVSGQLSTELDTSGALIMENQNSFGYSITGSASQSGILEDYPTAVNDSYFSAWYNNGAGGVDYNDTTLYQNFEPIIETDIAPVGTFLEKRTFENIEFKLDRQLATGDTLRLSYRTSLSDSYTTINTTDGTTLQLSDNFNSNVENAQWLQLRVEFKCASSGSSRIPLREIRIH